MTAQKGFTPVLVIILIFLVSLGGYLVYQQVNKNSSTPPPNQIACTQDAKLCPDGTSVGRVGPNCEFAPCPLSSEASAEGDADISNWKTYTNNKYNFTIKYPEKISAYNENWQYGEYGSQVGFGPPSSMTGGFIWGVYVSEDRGVEELIRESGSQFNDRKEIRQNIVVNGEPAILVTVTTYQIKDWVSKNVYIQGQGRVYVIGNGAVEQPEFELFYKSFQFNK